MKEFQQSRKKKTKFHGLTLYVAIAISVFLCNTNSYKFTQAVNVKSWEEQVASTNIWKMCQRTKQAGLKRQQKQAKSADIFQVNFKRTGKFYFFDDFESIIWCKYNKFERDPKKS